MQFFQNAKLKAGVFFREWKEKAEARKAQQALHSEHGHGRFFLLHVPAAATICAAIVEWYWALLFCIEATGRIDWNYETSFGSEAPASALWNFAFSAHWPVLVGLVCATVPIVMLSMVWLPVQFAMRGSGRWRRGTVILCGLLANILVIVSGTVVMNYNRQDQVREAVVVEQTAAQGRAAIEARLAFEQEQLRLALNNSNPYLNQAANVGAAEWERSYVAQARATNDPRLPMLERALGAARAADQRRANIERLTIERATAAPEAASAANVEDNVGRELNTFAQYVEVWRPPFVAVICTLIGIFGAWWVLALMQGLNPRDVMRSGWADESHRIEDLRDQEPVAPQPMRPAREVVTDAETGEELVKVKPREYWRKRKGKVQKLAIKPEIPPDETGVEYDGGERTAASATEQVSEAVTVDAPPTPVTMEESLPASDKQADASSAEAPSTDQPEPPAEELEDITFQDDEPLADAPVVAEHQEQEQADSAEPDQESEHAEPRDEPETRESHLLAARTAAE
jgi:hypothetical protein